MQADQSMGVDVILRNCLVRWPWLTELSLVSAMMSIFVPDEKAEPADADSQLLPWMYVNAVLENVQFVLPLSHDLLKLADVIDSEQRQTRERSSSASGRSGQRNSSSSGGEGGLFRMASMYHRASKVPPETLSKAVMQRPAVFQLMSQAILNRMRELDELRPLHSTASRAHEGSLQMATPFLTSPSPSLGGGGGGGGGGVPEHTVSPPPIQRPAEIVVGDFGSDAGDELQLRASQAFTEMAVVFTLRAARYGLFYGDDGKSVQVRHRLCRCFESLLPLPACTKSACKRLSKSAFDGDATCETTACVMRRSGTSGMRRVTRCTPTPACSAGCFHAACRWMWRSRRRSSKNSAA